MREQISDKTAPPVSMRGILWAAFGIVALQVAVGAAVYFALDSWQERGEFGSMFGVVAALFSGLALAGVVYAILLQREELRLQRHELRLQRKELELTRSELARSARAQEEAAELLQKQLSFAQSSKMADEARRRSALGARLTAPGGQAERSGERIVLTVTNSGGPMSSLGAVEFRPASKIHLTPRDYVPTGTKLEIAGIFEQPSDCLICWLQYFDADSNWRGVQVEYWWRTNKLELTERLPPGAVTSD